MAYFLEHFPMTEEGKKLEFSDELNRKYRIIYQKSENDGNWVLYDLWDAHQKYNDDCIILPFQSTYDELEIVKKGTKFANIIGSTYDPKPKGAASWIGLMEAVYKAEGKKDIEKLSRCCTDGKVYVDDKKCDFTCNKNSKDIVGGHVIVGAEEAQQLLKGSIFELLPICKHHNTTCKDGSKKPGSGFYMETRYNIDALKMKKYLFKDIVTEYLQQHPLEAHQKL